MLVFIYGVERMLLAIDAGNTNIVFAVFDHGVLRGSWRTSTHRRRTADEYVIWLKQLMELEGIRRHDIDAVIIANVVPNASYDLERLCHKYFALSPLIVDQRSMDLGLKVKLDRPEDVGADRLVNAVAAYHLYKQALITIDFGTATTFDVIDQQGDYCGGVIAPGINLSLHALQSAAAKLPPIAIRAPEKVIGTNTIAAMESGIFFGYVSMIEGMVARILAEFEATAGKDVKVIATGGLGGLFSEAIEAIEDYAPDLTLYGLQRLYEMNSALASR